jgi:hypothetical protein
MPAAVHNVINRALELQPELASRDPEHLLCKGMSMSNVTILRTDPLMVHERSAPDDRRGS